MRRYFHGPSIRILAVACAAAGVAVPAWNATRRGIPPSGVVLVTLDTTRADRLTPYGFMDASMPHLERLARESVVFDRAVTPAPLTLPAHASLFTGLYPHHHGVRDNADRPLAAGFTTLAETLRSRGFHTSAFVGSAVLASDRGLSQGFETYGDVPAGIRDTAGPRQRRAHSVIGDAIEWLEDIDHASFFLWAHLYDPHLPYDPPEPFRSRHLDSYVGEIAYADAQLGRLIEALERRDLLDRTIVIVAGDHGESLGDHGERDHGMLLYEGVLRVPLLARVPGVAARRVPSIVRLIDVMPTLLDLLDLPAAAADGVSLAGVIDGREPGFELEALSESMYPVRFGRRPARAVRDGRFKLIDSSPPELYDLERDPFERRNLYEDRPVLARALLKRLVAAEGRLTAAPPPSAPPAELKERLAALGYAFGTP
jgi:arylsulfatase A-like enzyme